MSKGATNFRIHLLRPIYAFQPLFAGCYWATTLIFILFRHWSDTSPTVPSSIPSTLLRLPSCDPKSSSISHIQTWAAVFSILLHALCLPCQRSQGPSFLFGNFFREHCTALDRLARIRRISPSLICHSFLWLFVLLILCSFILAQSARRVFEGCVGWEPSHLLCFWSWVRPSSSSLQLLHPMQRCSRQLGGQLGLSPSLSYPSHIRQYLCSIS